MSRLRDRILEEHVELEMWCNAQKNTISIVILENEGHRRAKELF